MFLTTNLANLTKGWMSYFSFADGEIYSFDSSNSWLTNSSISLIRQSKAQFAHCPHPLYPHYPCSNPIKA